MLCIFYNSITVFHRMFYTPHKVVKFTGLSFKIDGCPLKSYDS